MAKAVFDIPTTRGLIARLEVDGRLRRLCGWSGVGRLPSGATFSRAFSEFAESGLASRPHETLIARTMDGHLVEHISRDATAIEAREKPQPKVKTAKPRRHKGEERAKEPSRLERQLTMTLPQMLADLPTACDVGTKRNAKGHTASWIGYKLRVDTADGGIPVSTAESHHRPVLHDGRVEMDTNAVENLTRPVNLTKKNALFAGSDDGARTWARSASLIGTCKLNDVNPQAYLADTLRRIVGRHAPHVTHRRPDPLELHPDNPGCYPGQTLMAVSPPEPERWAAAAAISIRHGATRSSARRRIPDRAQMRLRPVLC